MPTLPHEFSPMTAPGRRQWLRDARRAEVAVLWKRGLVPLAIAEKLGWTSRTVAAYLREAEALGEIEPIARGAAMHDPRVP